MVPAALYPVRVDKRSGGIAYRHRAAAVVYLYDKSVGTFGCWPDKQSLIVVKIGAEMVGPLRLERAQSRRHRYNRLIRRTAEIAEQKYIVKMCEKIVLRLL